MNHHQPPPPWLPLATLALTCTINEQEDQAYGALQQLIDQFGSDCLPRVMVVWTNTVLDVQGIRPSPHARCSRLMDIDTGQETSIQAADPSSWWAVQFINARACNDGDTLRALLAMAVESEDRAAECVCAMLRTCGVTIRAVLQRRVR